MKIPIFIKEILQDLKAHGFEAYIVGGSVRDFLLHKSALGLNTVEDWDITTNAQPSEIQKIFPNSKYENKFGTVIVLADTEPGSEKYEDMVSPMEPVEITTYRTEQKYSDRRHPDKVIFTNKLSDDLKRRDFTINAMAMDIEPVKKKKSKLRIQRKYKTKIIDLFCGQEDLKNKIVRAVGDPNERFNEDALRMIRAVRIAVVFNFEIERETKDSIQNNSLLIRHIAQERIRDELVKILQSKNAAYGLSLLYSLGLLQFIIPEFVKGAGVKQNRHHIYNVFEHGLKSLQAASENGFSLAVRLSALLHDIAKPWVKQGEGYYSTFHNHDRVGAKLARKILWRLKFSRKIVEKVCLLVRNHMFLSDPEKVKEAGARRLTQRAGKENMRDLLNLRIADRLGSGCPKGRSFRLRAFEYLLDKVSRDPISVGMLKINGNDIMKTLKIRPGPRIGLLLSALLAEILEDPQKNKEAILKQRIKELNNEEDDVLRTKGEEVKTVKNEKEEEEKRKFGIH